MAKTGREWKSHKYIRKTVNSNGKTVYIYPKRPGNRKVNRNVRKKGLDRASYFVKQFANKILPSVSFDSSMKQLSKKVSKFLNSYSKKGYSTFFGFKLRGSWNPIAKKNKPTSVKKKETYFNQKGRQYRKRKKSISRPMYV